MSTASFPAPDHDHRACLDKALGAADALCARLGVRLTPIRRRVLELIWGGHEPMGAYALLDKLREDGHASAPPTVYRALDFLLRAGLIHRLESFNAYVGCVAPQRSHEAAFLICGRCGEASELPDRAIADAVQRGAEKAGFLAQKKTVEILGLCAHCRKSP